MEDKRRNSIKTLTRAYYDYQRERTALDGRLGIKKDGETKKGAPEIDPGTLVLLFERREFIFAMEETILHGSKNADGKWEREGSLYSEIHKHPLWKNFLCDVKGCGEALAAVIISEFDINKAPTVSNLWSFAGLNPGMVKGAKKKGKELVKVDALVRGDRKTTGYLCPFNQFLRAKLCGVLGSSFLKCNSPYREFYDNMKNRLYSSDWGMASKNPADKDKPKAGHQHKAANRYMIKMFLKDLYVSWRTIEALPVREPYQEQYLGHKHIDRENQRKGASQAA